MAFSFVHIADVHLDTPFKSRDENLRRFLRNSLRESFKAAIDLAISERVDALLIAGDFFDNDTLSFSTEKFILDVFKQLDKENINVFYAPGNHDPYGHSHRISKIPWPKNVYIFNQSNVEAVNVYDDNGNIKAVVLGAAHKSKNESRNIAEDFPKSKLNVPHIGLLHCLVLDTNTICDHERYAPCLIKDLEVKDYTYWALGHIHKRQELQKNKPIMYSGNIMGRNSKETGAKGGYLVRINDAGEVTYSFNELSHIRWEEIIVDNISNVTNYEELKKRIFEKIEQEILKYEFDGELLIKVSLKGQCPLRFEFDDIENITELEDDIKAYFGIFYVEVSVDDLKMSIEIDKYKNQPHVLSKALEIFDDIKEDDELLLKLKPENLAGISGKDDEETVIYIRSLLKGADMDIATYLLGGDKP